MRITVSKILKGLAIIIIIIGGISFFIKRPIKINSFEQKKLYESTIYQRLEKNGTGVKAFVTKVNKPTDKNRQTLTIIVSFFNKKGRLNHAIIYRPKITNYTENDIVDILYDPEIPGIARVNPKDEMQMNWTSMGWFITVGFLLFWIGYVRGKVSGHIE